MNKKEPIVTQMAAAFLEADKSKASANILALVENAVKKYKPS